MQHTRVIYPVGQGGFAVEYIDDMCVVYDCGSNSNIATITRSIDNFLKNKVSHIDYLVISHFDKDHVNCIQSLVNRIKVKKALVPAVPTDMRIVYNEATNGAYDAIISIFREDNLEVTTVVDDYSASHALWVWSVKSIITQADWAKLVSSLAKHNVDTKRLNDAAYISTVHSEINTVFKAVWGNAGPNAKGLIMFSEKYKEARMNFNHLEYNNNRLDCQNTGCLYLGDACLNTVQKQNFVTDFLYLNKSGMHPLLLQVPHHGSKSNIKHDFIGILKSDYYFVCDADKRRINKNVHLSTINGKPHKRLMFVGMQFQQTIKGYIDVV